MKKSVSLLLSLLMIMSVITSLPLAASAANKSDLTFELNDDGESYYVLSCNESAAGTLSIPSEHNSKPVTRIGGRAFNYCKSLTTITIPESVTTIDKYAFYNCTGLTSIEIPGSVTSIGESAFAFCSGVSSVTIDCKNIDLSAFYVTNPETLSIGKNVTDITFNNFGAKLVSIEVASANKHYSSVDGVLLNKTKTTLIKYPAKKSDSTYEIPDTVTTISSYAFASCSGFTKITIPETVNTIGSNAFNHCTSLSIVSISNGVKSICDDAFYNCRSLLAIAIPDSVTSIGDTAFNGCSDFAIYCSERSYARKYAIQKGYYFVVVCDHPTTEWVVSREATADNAGKKDKVCTECSEVLETQTIAQLKCEKPALKKVYNANDYVKVTWSTVKGADKYYVYRKTGSGDYECIGSTTNTYFNDKKAGAGKTCRYKIRAKNEAGYSPYSDTLALKHLDEPTLKSIENTSSGVKITWDKVIGAKKYNVYRKVSGGEYKNIGETSKTSYTDKTAESSVKYYYAIRAKRDDSISSQSASLSKIYLATTTLNAPTSTKSGVKLTWSKVTGASGYVVYRKTGSGSYTELATVKGNAKVTYTDKSAKKGTKYYYKVKAYKGSAYSAYSNTKSVTDKY